MGIMKGVLHVFGKTAKVIGIGIGLLILLIIILLVFISLKPFVPHKYVSTVKTGGEIEAAYLAKGEYKISYVEFDAPEDWKKFEIWYPQELNDKDKTYPVVIVANGTGVKASKCRALFEHLASWGFIVAGNEDPSTYSGDSADAMLRFLLEMNQDEESIFYQKLDETKIGITGHSQGGVAVFNEIKNNEFSDRYTCAVSLSPTQEDLAQALNIPYDPEGIEIPVFTIAGTSNDVITLEGMESIYSKLDGLKAIVRRKSDNHGEMLYAADGYVTAWFMWHLYGDIAAAKAFSGEGAELKLNRLYQDYCSNIE